MNTLIRGMLDVCVGNIASEDDLKNNKIDTIVNAAKPTLMGSSQGVDGAIHRTIDSEDNIPFKTQIKKELDGNQPDIDNRIRCRRGDAVTTKGGHLCTYVIHVVGSEYDGDIVRDGKKSYSSCSSSRVQILEKCYDSIMDEIRNHPDMRRIAVPIISSGEYGFPFEFAAKIAVVSIGNALVEWKKKDSETFSMTAPEKIIFYIWNDRDRKKINENYEYVRIILNHYKEYFAEDKMAVHQNSFQSNFQILNELNRYDVEKGYFAVARMLRKAMLYLRMAGCLWTFVKDKMGGDKWESRRSIVEKIAVFKIAIAGCALVLSNCCIFNSDICFILEMVCVYNLIDTVSYLASLMLLADLQRPSANVIRSIILLAVNYFEMMVDMAFIYFQNYKDKSCTLVQALTYGILGEFPDSISSMKDLAFMCISTGLRFFFVTIAFGYFASHMRQREFRS